MAAMQEIEYTVGKDQRPAERCHGGIERCRRNDLSFEVRLYFFRSAGLGNRLRKSLAVAVEFLNACECAIKKQ